MKTQQITIRTIFGLTEQAWKIFSLSVTLPTYNTSCIKHIIEFGIQHRQNSKLLLVLQQEALIIVSRQVDCSSPAEILVMSGYEGSLTLLWKPNNIWNFG